jgi:DnaJ-class molecular chaperone
MEPNSKIENCDNCHGSGLVLESPRDGYHIYRQCHICRGAGYIKEMK